MSDTHVKVHDSVESRERMERRVLLRGAAWSIPTIALAVAAPAASASGCGVQIGTESQATSSSANTFGLAAPAVSVVAPAGATRMHFVVIGGSAANADDYYGPTVRIEGDLAVTSGETFRLLAGSAGLQSTGGKSLYGNGGNAVGAGEGGGAASALVRGATGMTPVAVAGGGGGSGINSVVVGGPHDTTSDVENKTYGASISYGGSGAAGLHNQPGENGLRVEAYPVGEPDNTLLWASGGQGGSLSSPGVAAVTGGSGTGANGAAGATTNGGDGGFVAGGYGGSGGGGGYFGGSGGAARNFEGPGYSTRIAGGGGGGSSFVVAEATSVGSTQVVPVSGTTHGLVLVTFFNC